jgi:hypothetical protein
VARQLTLPARIRPHVGVANDLASPFLVLFLLLPYHATIVVQMGQARWAGTRTAQKSPALARHGTEGFVPRAGPARLSGRAWAAISARRPNTGTTRNWADPMSARQF